MKRRSNKKGAIQPKFNSGPDPNEWDQNKAFLKIKCLEGDLDECDVWEHEI